MSALALVFLVLLLVPQAVSLWWKFAIWYVPLMAIGIARTVPEPGQTFYIGQTLEQAARWGSIIYIVISALIIAFVMSRKGKQS